MPDSFPAILVLLLVGLLFLILGYQIGKKQKITLLHQHHRNRVSEQNKRIFCALSGWGVLAIGMGIWGTGVLLWCTDSAWSFLVFAAGFLAGLFLLVLAGHRYNR